MGHRGWWRELQGVEEAQGGLVSGPRPLENLPTLQRCRWLSGCLCGAMQRPNTQSQRSALSPPPLQSELLRFQWVNKSG